MSKRYLALTAVMLFALSGKIALAQCGCSLGATTYAPVATAYSSYYAPSTAYVASYAPTTTYYAPSDYVASYTPSVAYYAPPATTYVTNYATPYVAAYTPYVASYTPYVAAYTPYTAGYSPYVAAYSPYAAYYGSYGYYGYSAYGTPTVYVPGQPVRNAFRALTP